MSEIEILLLSAEGCGYIQAEVAKLLNDREAVWVPDPCWKDGFEWSSIKNPGQRWQCMQKLLEMGYNVVLEERGWHKVIVKGCDVPVFTSSCHAHAFPAAALAELTRRSQA